MAKVVGGGTKKVLYTLNTVRKIGIKKSAKALGSKNTCKACGLGMGGQLGGMTNEDGEFPSVCNKSVQAQSTDIQSPIPEEIFKHTIDELKELTPRELEHLGRLSHPLYKKSGENHFEMVTWDWAITYAAENFKSHLAEKSFFYSSGRSSNESGFLLQLISRFYGTNNVTNCSFYCHQATSIGLRSSIGTGTATIELNDLNECDLIFVIGANPASNHPRFIHKLKNCRDRGGQVIVINPAKEVGLVKFAVPKNPRSLIFGGTEIASIYLQPNIGSDLALIKGICKAIIENDWQNTEFIKQYCDHYDDFLKDINETSWELIEKHCSITKEDIIKVARIYAASKATVFAWGMGITHHQNGCDNVEYIVNLSLLRGMIGKKGAGLLPLRGHSNVQGVGTVGVKPDLGPTALKKTESIFGISLPQKKGLDTLAAIEEAYKGNMDNAMIVGGNLYAATPDSSWAAQALNKIGFKVYLTTTLNQGHLYGLENSEAIILPVCARDEEQQSTTQESMFNYVRLSDGGIKRIESARSEVSILSEFGEYLLGKELFNKEYYANHQTLREGMSEIVPGLNKMKEIGINKVEFSVDDRIFHQPIFKTQDKKANFCIRKIPDNNNTSYSFMLSTVRSEGQFNSIIYEEKDSYRFNAKRDSLFICESDLNKLNLQAGQRVSLQSENGSMNNLKLVVFDLPPGNLMTYYPEANALSQRKVDPRSKTPNFKSIPVNILR